MHYMTDYSGGRSDGLVFPSLEEFSTVCCDPQHAYRCYMQTDLEVPENVTMINMTLIMQSAPRDLKNVEVRLCI